MTEVWTPKKGDLVKMSSRRAWGAKQGMLGFVRLSKVISVTKAGFVTVEARPGEKFKRAGDRVFKEWTPKAHSLLVDSVVRIEPPTLEEITILPTTLQAARAYADVINQQETA